MKNYNARIGLTALAFAGMICTSYHHPKESKGNYFTKEKIDAVYDATFKVSTTVTLENKVDDDEDFEKSWFGSGTLMVDSQTGDNYILTAEHVTPDPTYTDPENNKTTKVVKERIIVEEQEVYVFKEDEKNDLALLKLDSPLTNVYGQLGKPFKGKIAQSIDPKDYVIGVGFPKGDKELFNTTVTKIEKNLMYLDMLLVSGNSGGGIYLINNKDLQLCSIVTTQDYVPSLKKIREFFKDTPLEDDYLK